ncbi:MAG: PaaI family thioesterase [Dehalococcoidia bacterium]
MTSQLDNATLRKRVEPTFPFWDMLHLALERVDEPGHAVLSMPMRDQLVTRRAGVMHGGAIASLIDAAAGAALVTLRDEDDETWQGIATLDMNVSYLNAALGDVIAEAKVLRASSTIVFLTVDVLDTDGKHIATGRTTYTILRKR